MAKKTYGVQGMIEWHALIPFGRGSTMKVDFTGGTLTGYGISPAKFTTSNKMVQDIIERSMYYKTGKIILMNVYDIGGPVEPQKKRDDAKPVKKDEESTIVSKEEITVSSIEDAREILKERGISWTKLKSEEGVIAMAKSLNIEFTFE